MPVIFKYKYYKLLSLIILKYLLSILESVYLNTTLNFEIPAALEFQLEVYCKVDRLISGLTAQQIETTARWYSNKTPILLLRYEVVLPLIRYVKIINSSSFYQGE